MKIKELTKFDNVLIINKQEAKFIGFTNKQIHKAKKENLVLIFKNQKMILNKPINFFNYNKTL